MPTIDLKQVCELIGLAFGVLAALAWLWAATGPTLRGAFGGYATPALLEQHRKQLVKATQRAAWNKRAAFLTLLSGLAFFVAWVWSYMHPPSKPPVHWF